MNDFGLLNQCEQTKTFALERDRYSRIPRDSQSFLIKQGSYVLHNILDVGGADVDPAAWLGGYVLDQYIVPKGSVLDVTNIVYSMQIDDRYSLTGISPAAITAPMYSDFNGGYLADDYFLDPNNSRFYAYTDRRNPYQVGYYFNNDVPAVVGAPPGEAIPDPLDEAQINRYSGTTVLNRNILVQGDLNFHLLVMEDQRLEFIFETTALTGAAIANRYLPKARVIVNWCGRIIPKTVFEEVIKANR
jgi:hypothetical protein